MPDAIDVLPALKAIIADLVVTIAELKTQLAAAQRPPPEAP
jgi:hypothetical protein